MNRVREPEFWEPDEPSFTELMALQWVTDFLYTIDIRVSRPEGNLWVDFGMDSMALVELFLAIEDKFGTNFGNRGIGQSDWQTAIDVAKSIVAVYNPDFEVRP